MKNKKEKPIFSNIMVTVNGKKKNFGTDFNSAMSYLAQGTYDKLNKFKKYSKQGYPIKNTFNSKNGRKYVVIERPKGFNGRSHTDYAVGNGYNSADGTWAQGYYDFPTRKSAINFAKNQAYKGGKK